MFKKIIAFLAAAMTALLLLGGTAYADDVRIGWAFLFPIPLPIPIYQIPHERSPVTVGLLFPIPVPLPVYDYGYHRVAAVQKGGQRVEQYGQLQTIVRPKDASVFIDGKYYGRAGDFHTKDNAATVYPGTLNVVFKAAGYQDYAIEVQVAPGELVSIQYDLQPAESPPK